MACMESVRRWRAHKLWELAGVFPRADHSLAILWWTLLILRGTLPALFAIAMGALVAAIENGPSLTAPLALTGAIFVLLQILPPIHQAAGANLGNRTSAWLYDRLTTACLRPPGMGHLENPELTSDLSMARDFDLGITGPPMSISMDFIANGLVEKVGGFASAIVLAGYAWWAPIVLAGAWMATHYLLRESAIWYDRNTPEVREAQRHADYAFRLAVDPPAAKELRLFGLSDWVIDRFRARRRRLFELQYEATRLRERPMLWSLLLVLAANVAVFWSMGAAAIDGHLSLGRLVTFASAAIGTSMIAFGGLSWALDGAVAPVEAVLRLQDAMAPAGALQSGNQSAAGKPAREIRFRNVTFGYRPGDQVLEGFDLTIPAGSSLAIVGQNGPAKRLLRSCCAASTIRSRAPLKSTASICATSPSTAGARASPPCFRISFVSNCRCATTSLPPAHPMTSFAPHSPKAGASNLAEPRHSVSARLSRRHRSVGRPVAAHCARARPVRGASRRRSGSARRTHRAARRSRRSGNL